MSDEILAGVSTCPACGLRRQAFMGEELPCADCWRIMSVTVKIATSVGMKGSTRVRRVMLRKRICKDGSYEWCRSRP